MYCFVCARTFGGKVYMYKGNWLCINCVDTVTYEFIEFSPKVNTDSADNSYVGYEIAPSHNED